MLKQVIFDFDGTLVDSAPAILDCFRNVLSERGIAPRLPVDSRLIGPPLMETMGRLSGIVDPDELRQLVNDFKRHYDSEGVYSTVVYVGIHEMLDELCRRGYRLHIATNKRQLPTDLILTHLKLSHIFDSVYAIDSATPPYMSKAAMMRSQLEELAVPSSQSCYIGDKKEDGIAADANHVLFYAAGWGYGEWQDIQIPDHWVTISEPAQLVEQLRMT